MRYTVVAVGRSKGTPYAEPLAHYAKLLTRYARVDVIEVADDDALRRRIPERAYVCLLDSRGRTHTSEAFSEWVEERRQGGLDVCFVIGGAFGIELPQAHHKLSFGPMTLPHMLARVVLLEQLYRAHKILGNEPYHH
ncbi:23S rRNA (pseudouridine(1915)-N(3))-methyltransferase RlmH [Solirubrobacter sp. CPCC 204708]|uniref:Ribosomal RNA large subunit methyltransferase H n=1 Tax=Solirubrobacter deserti TaxID=2282478 RepID=A0ABT4RQ48_9ACTN|nr:23S rRNA (pseudouridine(1915)-N(3))-methyltransferase RlmH [Solirubrobacter deserti]MBE2319982.1 23S rRNA (pseudouridine(1915)-N(3))-methyltransferase RlmH [Solirubrobacter deserti]MDA0140421.1 23S rRNA (pseudouridine(1915)-N(3))-methyltransferase RlmH [Solirubrobacter deserti]